MSGRFIVLEGCDGVGKSLQANLLCGWLHEQGIDSLLTQGLGGSVGLGLEVRRILLDREDDAPPLDNDTRLYLSLAERAQHLADTVLPALARGEVVVCDRLWASNCAYQSGDIFSELRHILLLERDVLGCTWPDLTIILDCPPEIAYPRAANPNVFERRGLEFQQQLRVAYRELAIMERLPVIYANRSVDEVLADIVKLVRPLVEGTDA